MRKAAEMSVCRQVEDAFGERPKPKRLVESKVPVTSEQRDALWFGDRAWGEVTWDDWESHHDAFYAFTPEAFAYYLPSVLCLSSKNPDRWFWPADALIQILDRSPVVEHWDIFLSTRLLGLRPVEYEALKAWLLLLTEHGANASAEALGRAFDTVALLQSETERVRAMVDQARSSG
ncbi:MAG: hypothetical protein K2Q07_09870 [Burkholderiaceae bacterium]|nr:hypothetical protein [Burkholderiaceae bacterium]